MNNKDLSDITSRLAKALSSDYDVIDLDTVLSIISILERTTITKEQLETTRLAKFINHLRRRTQIDQLARRAKSLLKRWREMVGIHQSNDVTQSNPVTETQTISIVDNFPNLGHSQPASPAVSALENVRSNSSIDLHSSSTGKSGYSKKQMVVGNVEHPQAPVRSGRAFISKEITKLPTSFSNLIPEFSSEDPQYFEPKISQRNPRNSQSTARDFDAMAISNSNSELTYNPASIDTVPIVIDIPDSSSGSNLIVSPAPTMAETIPMQSSSSEVFGIQFKHKKNKKDKKRKDDKTTKSISSQNQFFKQHAETMAQSKSNATPMENKYKPSLITSNISEILSLSNSSMSSIFTPNEDALKLFNQQKSDKQIPPTKNMLTNELSFAGKFNKNYTYLNSENTNADMMSIYPSPSQPTTGVEYEDTIRKTPANSMKFSGGNDTNVNSNDSTLNYRMVQVCLNETPLRRNQSEQTNFDATMPTNNSGQQHTISNTESDNITLNAEKKVPKKRGRKKGSRGVDSVIAKETSLSSQMLITSLGGCGKKVKTTKELYAEMQNRKLGIVPTLSSPTLITSRPASSCSEPSVQSPRTSDGFGATVLGNETTSVLEENKSNGVADDDSETVTSEPSRDSGSPHKSKMWIGESKFDANIVSALSNEAVNKQLLELMKDFPPKPSMEDIEKECLKETFPCTCEIIDVVPKNSDDSTEDNEQRDLLSNKDAHKNTLPTKADENLKSEPFENKVPSPAQTKKSIFDLDFDEDEDPLLTILSETTGVKQEPKNANIQGDIILKHEVANSDNADLDDTLIHFNTSDSQTNFPSADLPVYAIAEDPECKAKDRFLIQTQKITNFHINALHNCYITNINGNWDDTEKQSDATTATSQSEDIHANVDDLLENVEVVPKFGTMVPDFLRKDLRHVPFTKNFVKQQNIIIAFDGDDNDAVFLGVSRQLAAIPDDEGNKDTTKMSSPTPTDVTDVKVEKLDLGHHKINSDNNIGMLMYSHSNGAGQNPINNIDEHDGCPLGSQDFNEIAEGINTPVQLNEDNRNSSRCSSSCSNSSLKQIQKSINLKLKNQKLLQIKECDSNVQRRKRKRKKYLNKSKRSKRISLDSNSNSSDEEPMLSGSDNEETTADNESTTNSGDDGDIQMEKPLNGIESTRYRDHDFCDYHEVVTRDLSIPSTGSNHIVLTFKKTNKTYNYTSVPLKLPPTLSDPEITSAAETAKITQIANVHSGNGDDDMTKSNVKSEANGTDPMHNEQGGRKCLVLDDSSSVKNRRTTKGKEYITSKSKKAKSLQKDLFFDHEIYALPNSSGSEENENMNESDALSDLSDESESTNELTKVIGKEIDNISPKRQVKIEHNDYSLSGDEVEQPAPLEIKSEKKHEDNECNVWNDGSEDLPEENNGLLLSFNNIYKSSNGTESNACKGAAEVGLGVGLCVGGFDTTTQGILQNHTVQLKEMLPNKNCDDFNTLYFNDNNFNLTKYNNSEVSSLDYREECKNICNKKISRINNQLVEESSGTSRRTPNLLPHKEFRTGLRAVDEDVHDEEGNNCSRTQQFKEWHQVLQLRSYNDELLTVLPYVVLE